MKKTILPIMALLALTKTSFAETVPPEKAKAIAASFLNSIQSYEVTVSSVLKSCIFLLHYCLHFILDKT